MILLVNAGWSLRKSWRSISGVIFGKLLEEFPKYCWSYFKITPVVIPLRILEGCLTVCSMKFLKYFMKQFPRNHMKKYQRKKPRDTSRITNWENSSGIASGFPEKKIEELSKKTLVNYVTSTFKLTEKIPISTSGGITFRRTFLKELL